MNGKTDFSGVVRKKKCRKQGEHYLQQGSIEVITARYLGNLLFFPIYFGNQGSKCSIPEPIRACLFTVFKTVFCSKRTRKTQKTPLVFNFFFFLKTQKILKSKNKKSFQKTQK